MCDKKLGKYMYIHEACSNLVDTSEVYRPSQLLPSQMLHFTKHQRLVSGELEVQSPRLITRILYFPH